MICVGLRDTNLCFQEAPGGALQLVHNFQASTSAPQIVSVCHPCQLLFLLGTSGYPSDANALGRRCRHDDIIFISSESAGDLAWESLGDGSI
jgi:hypothetical protein